MTEISSNETRFLPRKFLQSLLDALIEVGYEVIGPKIQQHAIVYRTIDSIDELPRGWTDHQAPAVYQISETETERCFYFNSSPDSWKRYLFPASSEIGSATLKDDGWHFETPSADTPKYAFLGVRSCDLAAIAVQDKVLAENDYVDAAYKRRREAAFYVAVNCSTSSDTCFCMSMDGDPECQTGFDLVMTETNDGFLIQAGTQAGASVLNGLPAVPATDTQKQDGQAELAHAREKQTKRFDNQGVRELLLENLEHANWQQVAERCLSCANCTMVCPTCFCSTVDEVSNLAGTEVARVKSWDSCFNVDFSYTAGGTVRDDVRSRYRQWLTHKLATWEDQFDVSGCVGCGRCITWCPVGIDLTKEVEALRE